jgi:hypothetical protein
MVCAKPPIVPPLLGLTVTLLVLVVIAALLLAATVGFPGTETVPVSVAVGMVQDWPAPESTTMEPEVEQAD